MHAPVERTRLKKHTVPLDEHQRPVLTDVSATTEFNEVARGQRRGRFVLTAVAALIVLAISAALFVLPIKSWLKQRDQLSTRADQLATLDAANNQLQTEVDRLQTNDGVKQAAREVIDYVEKGEQRITVMPVGSAPTALPDGWPYNLITKIIAIRQAEAGGTITLAPSTP